MSTRAEGSHGEQPEEEDTIGNPSFLQLPMLPKRVTLTQPYGSITFASLPFQSYSITENP